MSQKEPCGIYVYSLEYREYDISVVTSRCIIAVSDFTIIKLLTIRAQLYLPVSIRRNLKFNLIFLSLFNVASSLFIKLRRKRNGKLRSKKNWKRKWSAIFPFLFHNISFLILREGERKELHMYTYKCYVKKSFSYLYLQIISRDRFCNKKRMKRKLMSLCLQGLVLSYLSSLFYRNNW